MSWRRFRQLVITPPCWDRLEQNTVLFSLGRLQHRWMSRAFIISAYCLNDNRCSRWLVNIYILVEVSSVSNKRRPWLIVQRCLTSLAMCRTSCSLTVLPGNHYSIRLFLILTWIKCFPFWLSMPQITRLKRLIPCKNESNFNPNHTLRYNVVADGPTSGATCVFSCRIEATQYVQYLCRKGLFWPMFDECRPRWGWVSIMGPSVHTIGHLFGASYPLLSWMFDKHDES